MYALDRQRLDVLLAARGWSLVALAKRCGISRKSLYAGFEGRSIFSVPFQKVMAELGVGFEDLVTGRSPADDLLVHAPVSVQRAVLAIQTFAAAEGADLFVIGSRARGKRGLRADWDFGVFFPHGQRPAGFVPLKARAQETAFPYRLDLVDLTAAPAWFLQAAARDAKRLTGGTPATVVFSRTDRGDGRVA